MSEVDRSGERVSCVCNIVQDEVRGELNSVGFRRGRLGGRNCRMTKAKKSIVIVAAALVIACAISPFAWHAGTLYWAKSSARRALAKFTPEERRNLNVTPTLLVLPDFDADKQAVETVKLGDYEIRIPRPIKCINGSENVRLTYPRCQVAILHPFPVAESAFDEMSAVHHARFGDLDNLRDLPSVKRYLSLMAAKLGNVACGEEFKRADVKGFILSPTSGGKRTVVEIFLPRNHSGSGVWFTDTGGLTPEDVHDFLSVLRFKLPAHRP